MNPRTTAGDTVDAEAHQQVGVERAQAESGQLADDGAGHAVDAEADQVIEAERRLAGLPEIAHEGRREVEYRQAHDPLGREAGVAERGHRGAERAIRQEVEAPGAAAVRGNRP
ncbi:MAG: hypothetical protein R2708_06720 [Vicinamibacterales bacterium]